MINHSPEERVLIKNHFYHSTLSKSLEILFYESVSNSIEHFQEIHQHGPYVTGVLTGLGLSLHLVK